MVEKNIADFFIHNHEKMDFFGENSCRKIICIRGVAFQICKEMRLQRLPGIRIPVRGNVGGKKESMTGNTRMVLNAYQELLNKTYSLVDEEQIGRIGKYLNQAERVFVCGKGSSGLAASEMELRFMRIGVDIDSLQDSDRMRMQAVFQDKRCLVFGISISGETEGVRYLLREAHKRGAKTVMLTAQNKDSYAEYCSEVLLLPSLRHLNHEM